MTDDLFLKMKAYAIARNKLESYVLLKEDEKGRYIEWAFKEGAPHDNRCLSWYDSWQPKAVERNGHNLVWWKNSILKPVGDIYELGQFACDREGKEGEEHCSAGHPCKKCLTTHAYDWTYEEPVKCVCWLLYKLDDDFLAPIIEATKMIDIYNELKGDKLVSLDRVVKWMQDNLTYIHPRTEKEVCMVNIAHFLDDMKKDEKDKQ